MKLIGCSSVRVQTVETPINCLYSAQWKKTYELLTFFFHHQLKLILFLCNTPATTMLTNFKQLIVFCKVRTSLWLTG
jgi:hypothetical protein